MSHLPTQTNTISAIKKKTARISLSILYPQHTQKTQKINKNKFGKKQNQLINIRFDKNSALYFTAFYFYCSYSLQNSSNYRRGLLKFQYSFLNMFE
jgi:hypothetical protein